MSASLIQIGNDVREMTEQEIADCFKIQAEIEALAAAQAGALEARKEPLRRLGLTEDEINIVLGL
jgi:DNA-binding GntR family transcriptional regulator